MIPPHRFPLSAASADALPAHQRRAVVLAIVLLHGVAGWAVLQVPAFREALAEAAPLFVQILAPQPTPPQPEPPPPPRPPQPIPKAPPPPAPLISAAPTPTPPAFVAPAPPETPEVPAPPAPPVVVVQAPPPSAPAPPAPPPPEPKLIPASAVQYLEPPVLVYPRLSARAREAGRVMVRVLIDEAGQPRSVQVSQSSGHPRLDEAAVAAVQKARFKPHTENGKAVSVWALIPANFDLEN